MSSGILNKIGLGNIDIGILFIIITAVIVILLILCILSLIKIKKLTTKYNFFMKGRAAKSLENEIAEMFSDNAEMKEDISKAKKDIRSINKQLEKTYQKMGLVKYDAFNQMGGKLSFCLALLDEENNGFILNSVHSTDSCYSYIKRIENGMCKIDLSNEEAVALQKATSGEENEAN